MDAFLLMMMNMASHFLFHYRVLKVIEDLPEALETKETRYICRL